METDRLKKLDLFSSVPDDQLDELANVLGEVSLDEGDELVRAGTPPDQLFVIEEGEVEVVRDGEKLATLGPGDVIGERGTVKHGLRNANAVAKEPVRAIFLTGDQVRRLRRDNPDFDKQLQDVIEERGE